MIKRLYCEKWNSYYIKNKWLESTGCGKNRSCKKCTIKCFNRPLIPCVDCNFINHCNNIKNSEIQNDKN